MIRSSGRRRGIARRIGKILRPLAFVSLLAFSVSCPAGDAASEENFDGERELLKRIEPEERYTYFGTQYLMNPHQALQYLSLIHI